jgi:hypothetical protein
VNEEAIAHWGLLGQKQTNKQKKTGDKTIPVIYLLTICSSIDVFKTPQAIK